MPTYNKIDMLNCCQGFHDFSDETETCHVCGCTDEEASAPTHKEPAEPTMTRIYQAAYESRHFSFEAYGETETLAWEALVDGMHSHAAQLQIDPAWFDEERIDVRAIDLGSCYRDRETIDNPPTLRP